MRTCRRHWSQRRTLPADGLGHGAHAARLRTALLQLGGSGIQAKPAIQYAQVVTDRPGQADISLLAQVKPCGKLVGRFNAAGIEADATREIPVSEFFPTVDTNNVRIGYLLDADNAFKVDWTIQIANDTSRPNQPTSLGLSQVSGSGAGTCVSGNTGDVDISSVTSPGTATNTPAWARIVARSSTAGGAVSVDQLLVDVQVS